MDPKTHQSAEGVIASIVAKLAAHDLIKAGVNFVSYSEDGRIIPNPKCKCKDKREKVCKKGGSRPCRNFGIPKEGAYGDYYHPQWMLDRRD